MVRGIAGYITVTSVFYRIAGDGVVKHYHIKKTDSGQFCIADSYLFDSLPELVVHHKHETSGQDCVIVDKLII